MRKNRFIKYIVFSTTLLIIGIMFVYSSFTPSVTQNEYLYTYNLNKLANYNIEINKNNFYENLVLEQNRTYISELVKNMNIDFKVNYYINKNSDIVYNYKIINTVVIKYASTSNSGDNILWSKDYFLKSSDTLTLINQNSFNIEDTIEINYQDYRNQSKAFMATYNLPLEAYMELKLILNYDIQTGNIEDKNQKESFINLRIPLLTDVFTVEENYQKNETETYVKNINIQGIVNKKSVIIGSTIISGSLIMILYFIRKEMKMNVKNDYQVALNRILKNYGDIVAEVVSPVETDYMKIIDVKNFDQLLDIEEEIRMPILFYETIPGQEGEFVILFDNMVYRYIISGRDSINKYN
ncbi:MAG TPA: DUF5305 family protein [Clostridia bacterium]|nr:DUF5305 family protein [Clostridia bacterium]